MVKKLIEMVCTGNNGRSPVAELVGRNYLEEIGASDDYDTISSGTMVDKIGKGGFSTNFMRPYVELAIGRGLYGVDTQKLDTALRNGDDKVVGEYFAKAQKSFATEEADERDKLLAKYGVEGKIKQGADQTVPRSDVIAILPADRKNYTGVLKILEGSSQAPIVAVMSALANQNPESEVLNSFGQGSEAYKERFEQIVREVPLAIQRLVGA